MHVHSLGKREPFRAQETTFAEADLTKLQTHVSRVTLKCIVSRCEETPFVHSAPTCSKGIVDRGISQDSGLFYVCERAVKSAIYLTRKVLYIGSTILFVEELREPLWKIHWKI
jgi:hypothetical protein